MARYVCDFDKVNEEAEKIITAAGDMQKDLNTYVTNVSEHLTGWGGTSAKKAFEVTDDEQVQITNTHVKDIEDVGNFIKKACAEVLACEEFLGGLKI